MVKTCRSKATKLKKNEEGRIQKKAKNKDTTTRQAKIKRGPKVKKGLRRNKEKESKKNN